MTQHTYKVCEREGCDVPVVGRSDARFCSRACKSLAQKARSRAPKPQPLPEPTPERPAPPRHENRAVPIGELLAEMYRLDEAAEQRARAAGWTDDPEPRRPLPVGVIY